MSGPTVFSTLSNTLKTSVAPAALNVADRISHGMYVVPAGHRLRTITWSLGFSLAGQGIMVVLQGERSDGTKVKKEDVPFFMRPFHGLLAHNKYSDDPEDRWKHLAAHAFPILGAAIGAYVGSRDWAKYSEAALKNLDTAKEVGEKIANKEFITPAEASIYADAGRSNTARILGGVLQGTAGLHAGLHQLMVPSVLNLGVGLGGAFLGANNRALDRVSTDGLRKSTGEMADHVARNSYNRVLSEVAGKDKDAARQFLAKSLKLDLVKDKEKIETALERVLDGGGVDMIETYANRSLHRYFAKAAIDYRKSLRSVAEGLKAEQGEKLKGVADHWLDEIKNKADFDPKKLQSEIEKTGRNIVDKAFGDDFLKTVRTAGFDESKIELGDANWVYKVFDWLNPSSKKAGDRLKASFADVEAKGQAFAAEQQKTNPLFPNFPGPNVVEPKGIGANLGSSLLLGTGAATIGAMVAAKPKDTPDLFEGYRDRAKDHSAQGFLNKHVLPKLEFVDRMSIADPSWGRFWLAAGFSAGLFAGDRLLHGLFGRSLHAANKMPASLTPERFKDVFAYDMASGTNRDRWMRNAHVLSVMAFGALGTLMGGRFATRDRRAKLRVEGTYLDDYEDRVSLAQGQAWEIPTAISSTPGSALGTTHFALIPGINYGANIANYHLGVNGGKVAWQGPGKLMTGSYSQYRFGPVKLLDHMIKYAAFNPDEYPRQLVDMASGIVKPWFPDATPEQVNAFVGEVLAIRNQHWQEGGIPAEKKEAVVKELTKSFRHAGLEDTLIKIGLNPAEAKLGNNGMVGTVGEIFGARKEVKQLNLDFLSKFETRHPDQVQARRERVTSHQPFKASATAEIAAQALADLDRNGGSFAGRVASKASPQGLIAARGGQSALQRAEHSRQEAALAPAL